MPRNNKKQSRSDFSDIRTKDIREVGRLLGDTTTPGSLDTPRSVSSESTTSTDSLKSIATMDEFTRTEIDQLLKDATTAHHSPSRALNRARPAPIAVDEFTRTEIDQLLKDATTAHHSPSCALNRTRPADIKSR